MNHENPLACYLSGQMSEAQMVAYERDDPAFAEYAAEHLRCVA